MGILDDAKDKLGDAAEWVKEKAEHLGEQAQDAGQTLGERAADARHWVGSKVGSDGEPEARSAGGGTFGDGGDPTDAAATDTSTPATTPADDAEPVPAAATEWVEVTGDGSTVDGAEADGTTVADDEPERDGGA